MTLGEQKEGEAERDTKENKKCIQTMPIYRTMPEQNTIVCQWRTGQIIDLRDIDN